MTKLDNLKHNGKANYSIKTPYRNTNYVIWQNQKNWKQMNVESKHLYDITLFCRHWLFFQQCYDEPVLNRLTLDNEKYLFRIFNNLQLSTIIYYLQSSIERKAQYILACGLFIILWTHKLELPNRQQSWHSMVSLHQFLSPSFNELLKMCSILKLTKVGDHTITETHTFNI